MFAAVDCMTRVPIRFVSIAGDGCGKGVDLTWDAEFTVRHALLSVSLVH